MSLTPSNNLISLQLKPEEDEDDDDEEEEEKELPEH